MTQRRTRTYAVLGATGQTGSEIVRHLRREPFTHLNVYARSASRLQSMHPGLAEASNVTLFIGDLNDQDLMVSCLSTADVVLSAVAQNRNEPGCSIAQRTALAIIKALDATRASGRTIPTVVFLASGGVDPVSTAKTNVVARKIFHWILYHVYTDLERSIELFRENPWVPLVIAAAGGLVHGTSHEIELTNDIVTISPLLSYPDLAQGMIHMGNEGEKWNGQFVGIIANGGKPIKGNPLALLRYLLPNLLAMVCPPLWWFGKDWWPK